MSDIQYAVNVSSSDDIVWVGSIAMPNIDPVLTSSISLQLQMVDEAANPSVAALPTLIIYGFVSFFPFLFSLSSPLHLFVVVCLLCMVCLLS